MLENTSTPNYHFLIYSRIQWNIDNEHTTKFVHVHPLVPFAKEY